MCINIEREVQIIQFPHPGGEHLVDYRKKPRGETENKIKYHKWDYNEAMTSKQIPWNIGPHRRKFIKNKGQYIDKKGAISDIVDIMLWCEWECPSKFDEINYKNPTESKELPVYLHNKLMIEEYNSPRENTDPYIFGDHFNYCVCRQKINKNPNKLYSLEKDSIILFGSCINKEKFVLDALFVVKNYEIYSIDTINKLVSSQGLSEVYYKASLKPLSDGNSNNIDHKSPIHCFYIGESYKNRPENNKEMYSFFPCRPLDVDGGFKRPVISLKDTERFKNIKFNDRNSRNISVTKSNTDEVRELWHCIKNQVLDQGLMLGIWTKEPDEYI